MPDNNRVELPARIELASTEYETVALPLCYGSMILPFSLSPQKPSFHCLSADRNGLLELAVGLEPTT